MLGEIPLKHRNFSPLLCGLIGWDATEWAIERNPARHRPVKNIESEIFCHKPQTYFHVCLQLEWLGSYPVHF